MESPAIEISAPMRRRSSATTLSPCNDGRVSPVTASFAPAAPAQSQKAALDQSPSALSLAGVTYRCAPETENLSAERPTAIPKAASAASVMST